MRRDVAGDCKKFLRSREGQSHQLISFTNLSAEMHANLKCDDDAVCKCSNLSSLGK